MAYTKNVRMFNCRLVQTRAINSQQLGRPSSQAALYGECMQDESKNIIYCTAWYRRRVKENV